MKSYLASLTTFFVILNASLRGLQGAEIYSNLGAPDSSSNAAIGYNNSANSNVIYA